MKTTSPAVLFLIFASFFPAYTFGQADVPKDAPKFAKSLDADYSKEPYVIELIETKGRFEADGKGQRQLTLRVRIQSESAVREFGLLAYAFASSFENLDVVYVRVRKPDGTVVETPASDVQELDSAVSREAPMYSDQREKHVAVKALAPGDVLEASFRWTVHDAYAPGHFWFRDSYFRAGICMKEVLQLDVPRAAPVKLSYSDPKPTIEDAGDRRIYTFQRANLKKPDESKIPDWEKNFYGLDPPEVRLTSFASWDEMGAWFRSLQEGKTAVTPEIRAKAEELTKGLASEEEKIRALYDFVSLRFRYIGVDLGVGRFAAHSAADILANRYGDCKDKHTLLAALLKSQGITAFPALISSRFRIDPDFPSADVFDHVLTAIPRGDAFLFLDTTPEVAPYRFLLAGLRDRPILVVPDQGVAKLTRTPADPPFPMYEIVKIDSSIDTEGTLDAKMRIEERGDGEFALRSAYRNAAQNQWDELTQLLVNRMGFAGKTSEVSVSPPEETAKPLVISFSYHRTEYPDWKNHQISLPTPFFSLPDLTDEQKTSKKPLPIGALQDVTFETTVKLPKDYSAVAPANVARKNGFAEFTAQYALESETIHGTLHFKTLQREVPGEKREQYTQVVKAADEVTRQYVPITGKSASPPLMMLLGNAGSLPMNPEAAIPELEKRLTDNPENTTLAVVLAHFYTKSGRAKDATALLEKILAAGTESSQIHLTLGEAYLAIPNADKAMEHFKKGLEKDPPATALNNVAYLLAEARLNLNEAEAYSKESMATVTRSTEDFAPGAAAKGEFQSMVQLAACWDTFGWIKFQEGNLESAEKYVKASWELSQTVEVGEHLLEIYEKEGKLESAAMAGHEASAAYSGDPKAHDKLVQEMSRLSKYLPQKRVDGAMELSNMRTLSVPFHLRPPGKSETAEVVVVIDAEKKSADVAFKSGSEELRKGKASLAGVKYPQSFPDNTPVKILRKGMFSCSEYTKDCMVILVPAADAAVGE